MDIVSSIPEMQYRATSARRQGRRIGLIPTMGCLHEGHMSLVRLARSQCDMVIVSIFVNPIQFGPGEDYARYPRTLPHDKSLCEREGTEVVFCPDVDAMYRQDHSVFVDEAVLSQGLCGGRRPGHFRGVLTVVAKLFNATLPDVAVFGQKDAQQARLIQRMATDLNMPVTIVVGPIVREPDGLAMSSRNTYLSATERQDALCLYRALNLAQSLFQTGTRRVATLREAMIGVIRSVPGAIIDYIEIVDAMTLGSLDEIHATALVALAVKIGKTRLIDNTILGTSAP